jgi:type II protein arginine methyltransferase
MAAIPASTPEFYRTVRDLLVSYNARLREDGTQKDQVPLPVIPALTPLYSKLSPGEAASQPIVVSSPWIDLGSPDSIVAELSRQVFNLEIAYAAFCGFQTVMVPGPNLTRGEMCVEGFSRFARAIQEALVVSNYINFRIVLPMAPGSLRNTSVLRTNMENLSIFADPNVKHRLADDVWGSWEAWNLTRSVCNYNQRLSVGKTISGVGRPNVNPVQRWLSRSICLAPHCNRVGTRNRQRCSSSLDRPSSQTSIRNRCYPEATKGSLLDTCGSTTPLGFS